MREARKNKKKRKKMDKLIQAYMKNLAKALTITHKVK